MSTIAGNPIIVAAAVLTLAVVLAAVAWTVRRRARGQELRDLREQLGAVLEDPSGASRIDARGRGEPFVDVAASLNQLLDRADEQRHLNGEHRPLFRALATTMPEVVLIHTESILFANPAAAELLGLDPQTLEGKPFVDLLRPAYRAMMRKRIGALLETNESLEPIEVQLINGDERGLWAELHSGRIEYRGEPAFVTVARDITHKKSLEATLGRGKLQTRLTLESIGEGIVTTDTSGTIDYMNPSAEQLIGVTRSTAVGKQLLDLIGLVDETDRQSLGDPVHQCLAERRSVNLGRRAFLTGKLSTREMSVELTAYPNLGPDRGLTGCVVLFHDVTELRGQAKAMSYQASHDALTGLVNRPEFERRLEAVLEDARLEGTGHVVCYMDLDRFKVVNDTHGHDAGDAVLRAVAKRFQDRIGDHGIVARIGGDEFIAAVTKQVDRDHLQWLGDNLVADASQPVSYHGHELAIGASVGIAIWPRDGRAAREVITAADQFLYRSKGEGRGRTTIAGDEEKPVRERLSA